MENNKTFVVMELDKPNKNNRIYTRKCMEQAIADTKKLVEENRFVGELDQISSTSVNVSNVSHIVKNIRIEDNKVLADIQILNTPRGHQLKELLDEKKISFVPRGLGKIDSDRTISDYKLISIDAVPSSDVYYTETKIYYERKNQKTTP